MLRRLCVLLPQAVGRCEVRRAPAAEGLVRLCTGCRTAAAGECCHWVPAAGGWLPLRSKGVVLCLRLSAAVPPAVVRRARRLAGGGQRGLARAAQAGGEEYGGRGQLLRQCLGRVGGGEVGEPAGVLCRRRQAAAGGGRRRQPGKRVLTFRRPASGCVRAPCSPSALLRPASREGVRRV